MLLQEWPPVAAGVQWHVPCQVVVTACMTHKPYACRIILLTKPAVDMISGVSKALVIGHNRAQQQPSGAQETTLQRPIAISRAAQPVSPQQHASSPQRWELRQPARQRDPLERQPRRRQAAHSPASPTGAGPESPTSADKQASGPGWWRGGSMPRRGGTSSGERGGSAFDCVATYAGGNASYASLLLDMTSLT